MPNRRTLYVAAACVLAAGAGVRAAQTPRHVHPPLPSVAEILDLGPAPAVTCTCVPHPFALPEYRSGFGYGSGPANPFTDPPMSDADRKFNAEWDAGEEREMRMWVERGLEGNANESLSVALHLAVHPSIFGPDDRVEQDVVRWLTLAAEQGHVDAPWLLAHRYAIGRGVPQDYAAAAYWFDQAARHDNPIAMTAIGFLRAAGRGAAQSWPEAIRWWRRAEGRTPVAARF